MKLNFSSTSRGLAAALFVAAVSLPVAAQQAAPAAATTAPPVAGGTVFGVSTTIAAELANGWSIKRSVLGKTVYNQDNQSVGKIDDVIVNPQGAVSYAVVNAARFLGLSKHDVLIPIDHFRIDANRITLPGATKDALRDQPKFEYAPGTRKALK